jgi:hypothetical protein
MAMPATDYGLRTARRKHLTIRPRQNQHNLPEETPQTTTRQQNLPKSKFDTEATVARNSAMPVSNTIHLPIFRLLSRVMPQCSRRFDSNTVWHQDDA